MMAGKITISKKRALGLYRIILPPLRSACSVEFLQAARKVRLQSDPQCELTTNSGVQAAIVPMGTKCQILTTSKTTESTIYRLTGNALHNLPKGDRGGSAKLDSALSGVV